MKTLSLSCLSLQATQALRYKMKTYTYVFQLMANLNPDLVTMGYINTSSLSAQRLAFLQKLVRDLYNSDSKKFAILEMLVTSLHQISASQRLWHKRKTSRSCIFVFGRPISVSLRRSLGGVTVTSTRS